jgi:hypothetical protein
MPAQGPILSASPKRLPPGSDPVEVRLRWSTGDGSPGSLYVSVDADDEELLARGSEGEELLDWLAEGVYTFHLYAGRSRTKLLRSLTLRRPAGRPRSARAARASKPAATVPRRGAVFVAFGSRYVDEAAVAAEAVRAHHPELEVALITDRKVDAPEFDRVVTFPAVRASRFAEIVGDPEARPRQRAFYNKILGLEASPYEQTVFFDSDTRVCAPLWEFFAALENANVVACLAPYRMQSASDNGVWKKSWFVPAFNSGVIGYRGAGQIPDFFSLWRQLFVESYRSADPRYSDQSTFNEALARSGLAYATFPEEFDYRISALGRFDGAVRVLHGRPEADLRVVEQFVNSTHVARICIPGVGMFWKSDGDYEFLSFDEASPIHLRRHQILLRLSERL